MFELFDSATRQLVVDKLSLGSTCNFVAVIGGQHLLAAQ